MPTSEVNAVETAPKSGNDPELHLLLAPDTFEPLWKSLPRSIDEFFFPKKLPPLKLESKPEPVKDIWGFYNYKKNGALGSTAAHLVVLGLIIGGTLITWHHVTPAEKPKATTELIDPGDFVDLKPAKTQAGGGGGGGDHDSTCSS
jgi:protein TonB